MNISHFKLNFNDFFCNQVDISLLQIRGTLKSWFQNLFNPPDLGSMLLPLALHVSYRECEYTIHGSSKVAAVTPLLTVKSIASDFN